MRSLHPLRTVSVALMLVLGVACSEQDSAEQAMVRQAVAIEQADECHLCGMIISNFPGPKGENYTKSSDSVNKFCSTRDLFSFVLQPENKRQVKEIYVHDMSKTPWQSPEDEYFIDAREAWFVIGSEKKKEQWGKRWPVLPSKLMQRYSSVSLAESFTASTISRLMYCKAAIYTMT